MLLQDMLQQNKEVKQKKGRKENQETGDVTQHKGTVSLNRPKHQANQTRAGRKSAERKSQEKKEAVHPTDLTK